MSKAIKTFSGDKTGLSAKDWLELVKNAALFHNWFEAFTFESAHTHVIGSSIFGWKAGGERITIGGILRQAF